MSRLMHLTFQILSFLSITTILPAQTERNTVEPCSVMGEAIGFDEDTIIYGKPWENLGSNGTYVTLRGDQFSFKIYSEYPQAYEVMEKMSIIEESPISYKVKKRQLFFCEAGDTVHIKMHSINNWKKNTVEGGKHNEEYFAYYREMSELNRTYFDKYKDSVELLKSQESYHTSYYRDSLSILKTNLKNASGHFDSIRIQHDISDLERNNNSYTDAYRKLETRPERDYFKTKFTYIKEHMSIVSYFLLYSELRQRLSQLPKEPKINPEAINKLLDKFEKKYPGHLYRDVITTQLAKLKINN